MSDKNNTKPVARSSRRVSIALEFY